MIKSFLKELYNDRRVIFDLAKNDFRAKYTNSLLGIVWAFLLPLTIILVLWYVFQMGFKSFPVENVPFILWYIPAFLSWNFFSEAFSSGSSCIFDYSYLVRNVNFRLGFLPLVKIISSSFVHLFFIGFIFLMYFIYGWYPSIYNIQVIYYYLCLFAFLFGITLFMSALSVFSKDILNIISLITQVGFWATPLVWDPSRMSGNLQIIVKLNPMYYICCGYRETFCGQTWFWEHPTLTMYFWGVVIGMFVVGGYTFHRLRPQFADML